MSQDPRTIISRFYDAFGRQDPAMMGAVIREGMHPDFELDFSGSLGPERGVYRGEAGIRGLSETYWEAFETLSFEIEQFIDVGDQVVVVVHVRGRGRGSGAEVDARGPHVWWFRDGRVIGFTLYQEMPEALEAVGLSE